MTGSHQGARDVAYLLTVRQVAARLGVSTATVYALIGRDDLGHLRVSHAIRVPAAELSAYLTRSAPRSAGMESDAPMGAGVVKTAAERRET